LRQGQPGGQCPQLDLQRGREGKWRSQWGGRFKEGIASPSTNGGKGMCRAIKGQGEVGGGGMEGGDRVQGMGKEMRWGKEEGEEGSREGMAEERGERGSVRKKKLEGEEKVGWR
jgi:hypothetical protein